MRTLYALVVVAVFSFLGGFVADAMRANARDEIGGDVLRCKKLIVDDIIEVGKTIRVHGAGGIYVSRDNRCISIYDDGKQNGIGLHSDMQKNIGCDVALTASPEKGGAIQFVKGQEIRFLGFSGHGKEKIETKIEVDWRLLGVDVDSLKVIK